MKDKRERAIEKLMATLVPEDRSPGPPLFPVGLIIRTYRHDFDDGRSVEISCDIRRDATDGGDFVDARARRQVSEAVVDERHRLRMARLNNQTAIERLEAELAAVKAERDALRGQHDATPQAGISSKVIDDVAGAVRVLQRALMMHTMELPLSITIELSPGAYFHLGRCAQEASPTLRRWREFFLLDDFAGRGPVVVKPGDPRMPDIPDEKGDGL